MHVGIACAPVAQHLLLKSASVPLRIPLKEKSITTLPHLWTGLFRDILRLISLLARSGYTVPHASHAPYVRFSNHGQSRTEKAEFRQKQWESIFIKQNMSNKNLHRLPRFFGHHFLSPTAISMNFAGFFSTSVDSHIFTDELVASFIYFRFCSIIGGWTPS